MPRSSAFRQILMTAILIGLVRYASNRVWASEERWDAPTVKVVTPDRAGYVMQSSGEKKMLVCIEVTDVAGVGIDKTGAGIPRFMAPNHNVALFLDYIAARSSYINKLGQEVVQITSLVPVEKIKAGDALITPPIDFRRLRPSEGERKFPIPASDMVKSADFAFQVKDLRGVSSDPEAGHLTIGFASGFWTPTE